MTADRWPYSTPAPGLLVTVGSTRPVEESLPFALPIVRGIAPQIVMPHMYPDARRLREAVPNVRVWVQTPANLLVKGSDADVTARVRGWVENCLTARAELLVFNGEGAYREGLPGWKRDQPLDDFALATRAQLVLDVARDAAKGELALGWSTHDRLRSHGKDGLPVNVWFGPSSPCVVNASQEYTFMQPRFASLAQARARHDGTALDHMSLVEKGLVRRELTSGGAGYLVVAQAHHHDTDAAAYYYDQSALAGAWTIEEGSCDAQGVRAHCADARLRERVGHAPGRIARWREECGLGPGPLDEAVLGSLGLTE
jgi:hypothetical protein